MRKSEFLSDGLTLEVNGQRLSATGRIQGNYLHPRAGCLPTMKIGVLYKAKLTGQAKTMNIYSAIVTVIFLVAPFGKR